MLRHLFTCILTLLLMAIGSTGFAEKKPLVFVSILPQQYFVERLAGDLVDVEVLLPPGQSPATYSPTAKQILALSKADYFFRIGAPFEKAFVSRLKGPAFQKLKMSSGRAGVILLNMGYSKEEIAELYSDHNYAHKDHDHEHGEQDPHIWLNPQMTKKLAHLMTNTLKDLCPEHQTTLEKNYDTFASELEQLDAELLEKFKPHAGKKMYVYHPSWGYFCERYGLVQESIEAEGKEPTVKRITDLAAEMEEGVTPTIFVQPQFSMRAAHAFAEKTNANVISIDPLGKEYFTNMREVADYIAASFAE